MSKSYAGLDLAMIDHTTPDHRTVKIIEQTSTLYTYQIEPINNDADNSDDTEQNNNATFLSIIVKTTSIPYNLALSLCPYSFDSEINLVLHNPQPNTDIDPTKKWCTIRVSNCNATHT